MKKRPKIVKNSARKSRRLLAITIILAATAIIATGAVTVVTRQNSRKSSSQRGAAAVTNGSNRNYMTLKVAGQDVQVDAQTGRVQDLTPEEAQRLATALKQRLNKSTEGLMQEQQGDGSVTMELDGRFQNVTVAKINEDGSVSQACVDNPEAAGNFFGIDPQLMGGKPNEEGNPQQTRVVPAKN